MNSPTEPAAESPLPDSYPLPLPVRTSILAGGAGGQWTLVVGPRSLNAAMLTAIARLGERGPVRVLDGGNRFNAYVVARAARGQPKILNRITVSRAFTCYQVLSLLESTPAIQVVSASVNACVSSSGEETQASPRRLVALDLLNTFYDESVQVGERKRLLRACIVHLEQLAGAAGNAISIHPPAVASQAAVEFLGMLQASPAMETFFVQPEAPTPEPLRLF